MGALSASPVPSPVKACESPSPGLRGGPACHCLEGRQGRRQGPQGKEPRKLASVPPSRGEGSKFRATVMVTERRLQVAAPAAGGHGSGCRRRLPRARRPSPHLIGRRRKGAGRPLEARAQTGQGFPRRLRGGEGAGAGGEVRASRVRKAGGGGGGLLGGRGSPRNGWAPERPRVRVRVRGGVRVAGGGGSCRGGRGGGSRRAPRPQPEASAAVNGVSGSTA